MNMNEKKALYAFGCPNREATVKRLRMAAALSLTLPPKAVPHAGCKTLQEKCRQMVPLFLLPPAVENGHLLPSQGSP